MNIDLTRIIERGTRFAEQAISEDKEHRYELAIQAYIAASDCLTHVTKYGIINEQIKQNIHARIERYLERVEQIKNLTRNGVKNEEMLHDQTTNVQNLTNRQHNEGIIVTDAKATFDDIIGLAYAKTVLLEAVILPVKFPQLFLDQLKSSTPTLLYGPVDVGKTYLARSIAAECQATFLSVNAWEFYSKYHGTNEKYIRIVFQLARERQPSILFIDDLDGLCRHDDDTECGLSRRIKLELLIQIEAIQTDNANVFLLAAISKPWTLDAAIQRRFKKLVYVPLPEINERAAMFKMHFDSNINHTIDEQGWMQLAEKTPYYSAADIAIICRDALFRPLRQLISSTHFKRETNPKSDGPSQLWFACSSDDPNAEIITLDQIELNELYIPPVTMSHILAALDTVKPSTSEVDRVQYQHFGEENA